MRRRMWKRRGKTKRIGRKEGLGGERVREGDEEYEERSEGEITGKGGGAENDDEENASPQSVVS
eukprot:1743941-Pyramimonas_sp.AAC.1